MLIAGVVVADVVAVVADDLLLMFCYFVAISGGAIGAFAPNPN